MLSADLVAALVAFGVASSVMIAVAVLQRALFAHLLKSEMWAHVISHETKHRVGNVLAVIQVIAR